jgi:hypothetical protein
MVGASSLNPCSHLCLTYLSINSTLTKNGGDCLG